MKRGRPSYPRVVAEADEVDELLANGQRLLAEARATMADLDSAMNTAVNVIPPGALDAPPADDEQPAQA